MNMPEISYSRRNKLLLPLGVVVLLMCWYLAFSKTYEAIQLNSRLEQRAAPEGDLSYSPAYAQRKSIALDSILKGYKVAPGWRDRLWMESSAAAVKHGVSVDFALNGSADLVDTSSVGESQTMVFRGRFVQLLRVMNTVENVEGTGKISILWLNRAAMKSTDDSPNTPSMKLEFRGIDR